MLEELEHARARGAPILAEYIGGSFTCDAHHMTEPLPDGTGVGRCIAMCALLLEFFGHWNPDPRKTFARCQICCHVCWSSIGHTRIHG